MAESSSQSSHPSSSPKPALRHTGVNSGVIRTHLQECIQNCSASHDTTLEVMQYCLQKGGAHAAQNHIRLLQDCSQISRTSADFMIRNSPLHKNTCAACAVICDECAKSCARFDDEVMRKCAAVCNTCAQSCHAMVMM